MDKDSLNEANQYQFITPKETIYNANDVNLFSQSVVELFDKKFKNVFKEKIGNVPINLTLEIPIKITNSGIFVGDSTTKIGFSNEPKTFIPCTSGIDIMVKINKNN